MYRYSLLLPLIAAFAATIFFAESDVTGSAAAAADASKNAKSLRSIMPTGVPPPRPIALNPAAARAKPINGTVTDIDCDECGKPMVIRSGRRGYFLGCSGYPECKYVKQNYIGMKCPLCKEGDLAEKKARRRGNTFYGCSNYPNCKFTSAYKPVAEPCPQCGNPYLLLRDRKAGAILACDRAGCGFEAPPENIPPMKEVFLEVAEKAEEKPKAKARKPRTKAFLETPEKPEAETTWVQTDKSERLINFMKNVSIFGGMLLLMAFGPGRYSIDGSQGRVRTS